MLVSVFTPTHDVQWLKETYESLRTQTYDNWEWIILFNNGSDPDQLSWDFAGDKRIRTFSYGHSHIGALKNYACRKSRGELLVELDHDDWLMPNCLEVLVKTAEEHPAGFYYSDFLNLRDNGTDQLFTEQHGWLTRPCIWQGAKHIGIQAFEASARSLCEIFWAPNHVRAWSREAYMRAGGHDVLLEVGDDHDLVCRTYLAQVPFFYIPEVLYVYRVHENTVVKKNAAIQVQQAKTRDNYLHALIREECRRKNLFMLDVSPQSSRDITLMSEEVERLTKYVDSVGVIRINDGLQLIRANKHTEFFNHAYDALVDGGWLITATPAIDDDNGKIGRGAFQDPQNVSFWSNNNFKYFSQSKYSRTLPDHYYGRFQTVRSLHGYPTKQHIEDHNPYVWADLYSMKGQQCPGPRAI